MAHLGTLLRPWSLVLEDHPNSHSWQAGKWHPDLKVMLQMSRQHEAADLLEGIACKSGVALCMASLHTAPVMPKEHVLQLMEAWAIVDVDIHQPGRTWAYTSDRGCAGTTLLFERAACTWITWMMHWEPVGHISHVNAAQLTQNSF